MPVDRADRAAEHVVAAAELAGALDRDDVLGLLDHAQHGRVAPRVAADAALVVLGDVAADRQNRTLSLTSSSTWASRRTSAGSAASRWNAIRCALLGPTPGSRPSSSMRSWTTPSYTSAGASLSLGTGQAPVRARRPRCSPSSPPSRAEQPSGERRVVGVEVVGRGRGRSGSSGPTSGPVLGDLAARPAARRSPRCRSPAGAGPAAAGCRGRCGGRLGRRAPGRCRRRRRPRRRWRRQPERSASALARRYA